LHLDWTLKQTTQIVTLPYMFPRTAWMQGPAGDTAGPVVVSLTDFTAHRWRDEPGIVLSGLRLRRAWPTMQGAVGLWLWSDVRRRRSGSVSVWASEEDLRRFVRWPVHLAIVRRYRDSGSLTASTWEAERFDRSEVLREASRRLGR
jgi:hypothetical protein